MWWEMTWYGKGTLVGLGGLALVICKGVEVLALYEHLFVIACLVTG